MSRPDPITREVPPCKDCTDRHEACWGKCEKYKAWKLRLEELNNARHEYDRTRYNKYPR